MKPGADRESHFWRFVATCPGKGTLTVETDGLFKAAAVRAIKTIREKFGKSLENVVIELAS